MHRYFTSHRLSTFIRQVNWYSFMHAVVGPDQGSYYHEFLLRGRPDLVRFIRRKTCSSRMRMPQEPKRGRASRRHPLPPDFYDFADFPKCRKLTESEVKLLCSSYTLRCASRVAHDFTNIRPNIQPLEASIIPTTATRASCIESNARRGGVTVPAYASHHSTRTGSNELNIQTLAQHALGMLADDCSTTAGSHISRDNYHTMHEPHRIFAFDRLPVCAVGELNVSTGMFCLT